MDLQPFKLERYFAQYEFSTRYLLCSSDCESRTIADLLALEPGAATAFQEHWLGYTESAGAPALRQAISSAYTNISPNQILVHSGAEEAIFLFMLAVISAGDHIIVQAPGYQSLQEVARSLGAQISPWFCRPSSDWSPDMQELPSLLRPGTKALVINSPHNPTGYHFTQTEFQVLVEFCRQHGLLLFCDEVYRESEHDPASRLPAACEAYENGVSLGVLSKSYGLAGLRIGWVATHREDILQRMIELKDYTTICASAPSEFLAALALRHHTTLSARSLSIIRHNLALLDGFFERNSAHFGWIRPKAGPIAFPILLHGDIRSFCHNLVTHAGVLLLPGDLFNYPGNYFRLGFGRANMPAALAALENHLSLNSF